MSASGSGGHHDPADPQHSPGASEPSAEARGPGADAAGPTGPSVASIVLPVHDPPIDVLREALHSVDAQSTERWECVVVDDASTQPRVRDVLDAWCDGDRRRMIRRSANGGIAAATNDGLDAATGSVVVFLDHDDVLTEDAIATVLDEFDTDATLDLLYSDEEKIDEFGTVLANYAKPSWSPVRHLSQHYLNHLTAVRRSALGAVRARPEFEPTQDYDLVLRVIEGIQEAGRRVGHVDRVLYRWRAIAGSSALDEAEKPEMCDAVQRTVAAAVDRRRLPAEVDLVHVDGVPTTVARLRWHDQVAAADLTVVTVSPNDDPSDVDARVHDADTEFVALLPGGVDDPSAAVHLATELARRTDVALAGPLLLDPDGAVSSAGRVVEPLLVDPFEGAADDGGPWGVLLAAREVSALAPCGLVARRSTWAALGGLGAAPTPHGPSPGLDAAVAAMCLRAARDGHGSSIIVPGARLGVGHEWKLDRRSTIASALEWSHVNGGAPIADPFAPVGRLTIEHRAESVHERIARRIGEERVRLVTSDVFDTLVTRHLTSPNHLFTGLAERLAPSGLDPSWTPARVRAARRSAERRARDIETERLRSELAAAGLDPDDAAARAAECTLAEIWSLLAPALGVSIDDGIEAELALEAAALRPIPETTALYDQCRDAGIPVVLVSDIYLSADQLRSLLDAAGVPLDAVTDIVTSSDQRRSKHDGLLAAAIDAQGVDPTEVLHLGDNPIADVEAAEQLGCHVGHVELDPVDQHVVRRTDELDHWSAAHRTDLGLASAMRATLLRAGWLGRSASYQYGAVAAGPMLYGFGRWIDAQAAQLGVDSLHYLLREGDTIAELVDAATGTEREARRVHASRWVDVRAAVFDGTADEILAAIDRKSPIDAEHLVRAFDLPEHRVAELIGDDPVPPVGFRRLAHQLADDESLRRPIVDASARLRRRVVELLERELDLSQPVIVLVDVGWGGRIQDALTRILRDAGHQHPVVGLYLALSDAGLERIARGHDLRSYLPNVLDDPVAGEIGRQVAHHPEIVERVLMAPIPTFVDVDVDVDVDGDGHTRPVLADTVEPRPPSLAAALQGARDTVHALRAASADERWVEDLAWRAAVGSLAREAALAPSRAFAVDALSWSHDDLGGTNTTRLDGDDDLVTMVRSTTVRDIERMLDDAPVWIEGLAGAHHRSIAALRRAHQLGVPLEELAPLHPAGPVWISVFAPGSDAPVLQTQQHLGSPADDWSIVRRRGAVPGVRAIRFDPGETATLLELDAITVATRSGSDPGRVRDGAEARVTIASLRDPAVRVVGARIIDDRRAAIPVGGHVVILGAEIDEVDEHAPVVIDVSVRFRRWVLDDDDPVLAPGVGDRLDAIGRRARRALGRLRR